MAALGLLVGGVLHGQAATGIGTFVLVALAFLGGMFTPLSGTMLTISHYTPLWGAGVIVRSPVLGWQELVGEGVQDVSARSAVVNFVAWAVVLVVGALVVQRRRQGR